MERLQQYIVTSTGIAAFNIDELIYRLFQLLTEYGHTARYKQFSDLVLIRKELVRKELLIIFDEVSMISNVTLMYTFSIIRDI